MNDFILDEKLTNINGGASGLYPNERRKLTYEECKKVVSKYESYSELYKQDVSILMKIQKKKVFIKKFLK